LITRYPVSKLSAFSFLTPLFGVLAGWLFLDEKLSWSLLVALLLVVVGVNLVNRQTPPAAARKDR
jgi:drug/metabolite transporter (DMT)-like permease